MVPHIPAAATFRRSLGAVQSPRAGFGTKQAGWQAEQAQLPGKQRPTFPVLALSLPTSYSALPAPSRPRPGAPPAVPGEAPPLVHHVCLAVGFSTEKKNEKKGGWCIQNTEKPWKNTKTRIHHPPQYTTLRHRKKIPKKGGRGEGRRGEGRGGEGGPRGTGGREGREGGKGARKKGGGKGGEGREGERVGGEGRAGLGGREGGSQAPQTVLSNIPIRLPHG